VGTGRCIRYNPQSFPESVKEYQLDDHAYRSRECRFRPGF
jgi:hypothetical protein